MDLLKAMVRAMAQKTALLEDENAALKERSSDGLCCTNRLKVRVPLIAGQTHPTASVMGMPSAVKPLSTVTRTWNSAT